MWLTAEDEWEIAQRGLKATDVLAQILQFTHELKPIKIDRPCTLGDGIHALKTPECHRLKELYDSERKKYTIVKFVPASGAATRMFKHLVNYTPESASQLTEEFIARFESFPFFSAIKEFFSSKNISLNELIHKHEWPTVFHAILSETGLNYGDYPKGLIPFHQYDGKVKTAFEEHLAEAVRYARGKEDICHIHFTLSPQYSEKILAFLTQKAKADFPHENFEITGSIQSEQTDTIALDQDNQPIRDALGKIVFRPSGHGALIHNLQKIEADIIFIKNVDNVTTEGQRGETIFYKKLIGGLLISLKNQMYELLDRVEDGDDGAVEEAISFIRQWFQPTIPPGLSVDQMRAYCVLMLDRPLRICGMVRNEGEPGGGPLWVTMADGLLTKQIVEKSQIDQQDKQQNRIFSESSHFNPVDIVCSIRNRKGENYCLQNYIDHSTGFVTEKFSDGKMIQALELPGLWNGAMALWNTVFIEVPGSTFTPVKTVNDLLRSGHQDH